MSLARSRRKKMEMAPTIYSVICNIEVMGNGYVPTVQTYDSFENVFDPDYAGAYLNLFPRCTLIDPDSPIVSTVCNARLRSFQWLEVRNDSTATIYDGSSVADGYSVTTSGTYKGKLVVMRNGEVGVTRSLRFVGYYVEGGKTYKFEQTLPLMVQDVSSPGAELMIDSDKAITYNPLRMTREQTIMAKVMKGDKDITQDERCKLMWFRRDESGKETLLTAKDDYDNLDVVSTERSPNGSITSLTIDREMIGDRQTYAVYALYRANKTFPDSPEDVDARQYTTIKREFPHLSVDILGDGIYSEQQTVRFKALVSDNQGVLSNWNDYLYASWKIGDGNKEKEVARGKEVMLPLEFGKSLFCDLEPRGANKVIVTDSGEYLTDDDGALLIARDYEGD